MFENIRLSFQRNLVPQDAFLSDHAGNYHRYRSDHCDRIDDQRNE